MGLRRLVVLVVFAMMLAACGDGAPATDNTDASGPEDEDTTSVGESVEGAPFTAELDWGVFELNPRIAEKVEAGETDFRFIYVGFATSAPFYTDIRAGLNAAADDFGVDVTVQGPSDFAIEEQADVLESVMGSPVDGLIVMCPVADLFVPLIDQAVDRGIPVVTSNTDCAAAKRIAFVGQVLHDAGRSAAEEFLTHFREPHPEGEGPYTVALLSLAPESDFSRDRFAGFEEAIQESADDIELIGPFQTDEDPAQAFEAVETIYRGNPELTGFFVSDESVLAVGEYVSRNGLDEIIVVGFNLAPGIPELIEQGAIKASIGQHTTRQGYEPVEFLYRFLTEGALPTCDVCDVGAEIVNTENVDAWLEDQQ